MKKIIQLLAGILVSFFWVGLAYADEATNFGDIVKNLSDSLKPVAPFLFGVMIIIGAVALLYALYLLWKGNHSENKKIEWKKVIGYFIAGVAAFSIISIVTIMQHTAGLKNNVDNSQITQGTSYTNTNE